VARQVVHDDDVARLELGNEELLDIGFEGCGVDGAVEDGGATRPSRRRPATKVVVFQWPWGIAALSLSPLGARP
jgi:hypothetical protein